LFKARKLRALTKNRVNNRGIFHTRLRNFSGSCASGYFCLPVIYAAFKPNFFNARLSGISLAQSTTEEAKVRHLQALLIFGRDYEITNRI
jgi:hypothetical protein